MAGAQIKRFLILHKELDPDDGEITRTLKVRRGFVAERYAPLINALYDGSKEADISTEVTFEDGRKGVTQCAREDPRHEDGAGCRQHGEGGMRAPGGPDVAVGDILLAVEDVSLSFGGVKAVSNVSFDIRKGEIRAIIGPNGAGKDVDAQRHQWLLSPATGPHHVQGQSACQDAPARGGDRRHRTHVPERGAVSRHDCARQHHGGPHTEDAQQSFLADAPLWTCDARGGRASPSRGRDHRFPQDPGNPARAGRPAALRLAEARRAWPRAGDGA